MKGPLVDYDDIRNKRECTFWVTGSNVSGLLWDTVLKLVHPIGLGVFLSRLWAAFGGDLYQGFGRSGKFESLRLSRSKSHGIVAFFDWSFRRFFEYRFGFLRPLSTKTTLQVDSHRFSSLLHNRGMDGMQREAGQVCFWYIASLIQGALVF